jgi:hypothetical protein
MYTTMAFVALTMGNLSGTPTWQHDYRAATQQVSVAGKPMVVFIGQAGPQSVVREGTFSPELTKLLSKSFVCVYVDTSKAEGQSLAKAFRVNNGVVISDRTGSSQVFSLAGQIAAADLSTKLLAYADADPKDVKKTDSVVTDPKAVAPPPAAGGPVPPPPGMMMAPPPGYMGGYGAPGCGGQGYGGGCCNKGGYGGGYGGGCCFFGGCCNKGYAAAPCGGPVMAGPPPAPCGAPVMAGGCCNKGGYSGGCCFFGGCCNKGGYGGGYAGGCGGSYYGGGCCGK